MKVSWEESRRHGERERLKADRWMRQREEVRMVEPGERKGTVDAGAREKMRNVTEGHWQERRREREKVWNERSDESRGVVCASSFKTAALTAKTLPGLHRSQVTTG